MSTNQSETPLATAEALVDAAAEKIRELADSLSEVSEVSAEPVDAAVQRAHDQIAGLRNALATRTVIGQAVGLLMGRYDLSADEAFATLVHRSSHTNRKIRDLAAEMLMDANAVAGCPGGVLKSVRMD